MSSRNTASGQMPSVATVPTRRIASTIEAAGVALVDEIGQQIPIGNDRLPRRQRRPNHLVDELGSGRHVQQHLGRRPIGVSLVAVEQDLANPLAQRRAARIAASRRRRVPARASQSQNKSICVVLPTPSMPSKEKNMGEVEPLSCVSK